LSFWIKDYSDEERLGSNYAHRLKCFKTAGAASTKASTKLCMHLALFSPLCNIGADEIKSIPKLYPFTT
jgi:hypothetical protein